MSTVGLVPEVIPGNGRKEQTLFLLDHIQRTAELMRDELGASEWAKTAARSICLTSIHAKNMVSHLVDQED